MSTLTYEGIVEDGKIRLESNVRLPEKAKVLVLIRDTHVRTAFRIGSPRLVHPEDAAHFKMEVEVIKGKDDAGV